MTGLNAPATFTLAEVFQILGAAIRSITALLVVMMGWSEWLRTRRDTFRYIGVAFLLATVGNLLTAVTPFAKQGLFAAVAQLVMPVWGHLLESLFLIMVCHAMAVHERGRIPELRQVTRRLVLVSAAITLIAQGVWYWKARYTSGLTFSAHPAESVLVGWELALLALAIYLATSLKPEIQVRPAMAALAIGKIAHLANIWAFDGAFISLDAIEWIAGATAAVLLLAGSHLGIVTETFTDALTRLHNRRYFMMRVTEEFGRAVRKNAPVTILVMDLDHFKRFNDTQGHVAGDTMLRSVARLLNKHLRPYDILCRWGGEEFIALLPETDIETGAQVAERLRQAVEDLFGSPDRRSPVTISIGVAGCPDVSDDWRHVVEAADRALYKAKERRNRVSVYVGER